MLSRLRARISRLGASARYAVHYSNRRRVMKLGKTVQIVVNNLCLQKESSAGKHKARIDEVN